MTTRIGLPSVISASVLPAALSESSSALPQVSKAFGPDQVNGVISSMIDMPSGEVCAAAAFVSPLLKLSMNARTGTMASAAGVAAPAAADMPTTTTAPNNINNFMTTPLY